MRTHTAARRRLPKTRGPDRKSGVRLNLSVGPELGLLVQMTADRFAVSRALVACYSIEEGLQGAVRRLQREAAGNGDEAADADPDRD